MMIHLEGKVGSRRVWLNGEELLPGASQAVMNHSPDGFYWGYSGSGPAQLALAISLKLGNREHYQILKQRHIAKLPMGEDFSTMIEWSI